MKNKKTLLYRIFTILLAGVSVFLLFELKNNYDLQYSRLFIEHENIKTTFSNHLRIANATIGYELDKNIQVEDENKQLVLLKNLILDKPILLYRVSSTHCSSCDEAGIQSLSNNSSPIPIKDIVIIGSFYNTQLMKSFKAEKNFKYGLYNLKQGIDFKPEALNFPYFLVINRDMKVLSCFFPEKQLPNLTLDYFDGIKHLFK